MRNYYFILFCLFIAGCCVGKTLPEAEKKNAPKAKIFKEKKRNRPPRLNENFIIGILSAPPFKDLLIQNDWISKNKKSIRFIDSQHYITPSFSSNFQIDSSNYWVSVIDYIPYNFNIGLTQEVLIDSYRKLDKFNYELHMLVYEYGCREPKIDIYSIIYSLTQNDTGEIKVLNYKTGDAD